MSPNHILARHTEARAAAEAHATACRFALAVGQPRPRYEGPSLRAADLRGAGLGCADLRAADLRGAALIGADLSVADLSGADLRSANLTGAALIGADLIGADLSGAALIGADLSVAAIAEGTVAASVAGVAGDYRWHALALADGGCVFQYGCDRAVIAEWRTHGPEYGARHHHEPEHWAIGPAVAIAAAEALLTTLAAERHGASR